MAGLLKTLIDGLVGQDPQARFQLLRRAAGHLVPGYRLKWPQMAWWEDARFNAVLRRFGEHKGLNSERRWMVQQLARLTCDVVGNTAECGVWQGLDSFLIAEVNRSAGTSRTHFAFDSFEGLSDPDEYDGDYWKRGDMAESEENFRRNLAEFGEAVRICRGWIPECFEPVSDERFSFVHVDVDLYRPTLDSLEFFYPRLSPGAILICDDYGFTSCPGATRAVEEFLADKPEKAIALSAGGGFFIRGTRTLAELSDSARP